jgi:hypothetical protein
MSHFDEKQLPEDVRDEVKKKRKDEWIEAWFAIEAMAINEDVVKSSLEEHIEKMKNIKEIFIYHTDFKEVRNVKKPLRDIEEAYSQVVNLRLFVKNLPALINTVILYGPSAIEVIGPENRKMKIEEIQNVANIIAGVIHQFAAAGVGGIVMTPEKPRRSVNE